MTSRNLLNLTCLALFLFASQGCSQYYTGAYGLSNKDRDAVLQYEKLKKQRAEQQAALELAEKRAAPASFDSGDPTAPPSGGITTQAVVAYQHNAEGQAAGSMRLYGQLPHTGRPRSSPLDGINNLRQVTFTTEGADFDPDIDPTGTWLVHASTRHRQTSDLYVKSVTGATLRQLTDDPANEVMPVFSPYGSRVAFASDRAGNWDIYIVDFKGGQAVQVTDDPTDDIHPSFSRDGQKLIYSSYGSQSGQWELVIVDLNNPSNKQYITHGLFPSWSPTQDKIVFQRARQRGTRWFSIWTIDLVNGEATAPTEIAASVNAAAITPDWSPDGRQIVFCTVIDPDAEQRPGPPQADIWLVNADGTNRVRLTMGRFANIQPVWSATGTIYFTSDRAGQGLENVWSIQPDHAQRLARRPVEPLIAEADDDGTDPESQVTDAMVPTE